VLGYFLQPENLTMPREPPAAEAIYGHLKSQGRPPQRPSSRSLAAAMYPSLVPKPKLPDDPYERHMRAFGLIRVREGTR
jgi:hypothetical protein